MVVCVCVLIWFSFVVCVFACFYVHVLGSVHSRLCVHLFVSLCVCCWFVRPIVCSCVGLLVRLIAYLLVCLNVGVSAYLFTWSWMCLFACLFA